MIFVISMLLFLLMPVAVLMYSYSDLRNALMSFQQNHYELPRYTEWLKEKTFNWEDIVLFVLKNLVFIVGYFIFNPLLSLIIGLILGFLVILKENKKKYVKPLVLTARVKRQLIVIVALYVLTTIPIYIFYYRGAYLFNFFIMFGPIFAWIVIYPMFYITEPIEAKIRNSFINEAKNIVNSNNFLIKVGITGSYGKTSTKNIVQNVISENYYSLMTPASFNTPLGITRTIRENLKPTHEVFICEMGADKVGEIDYLMNFVKPKYGLVTSIGPQHLNTFGSIENIIKEKMLMIEKLPSDGVGIVNYDNKYIREYKIKNNCKIITCGIDSSDVDYQAIDIKYNKRGSSFKIKHNDEIYDFETKLLGKHNIMNILMSVALAQEFNMSISAISKAVYNIEKIEHRLELKNINGLTFIDNAFNSNPEGSAMSLEVMKMMDKNRWIITPGMIDLGPIQEEANHRFGTLMKDRVDKVILVGRNQTQPILNGLKEVGFNQEDIYVVDKVNEAFALVYQNADVSDTILLENDLPDAFNV